MKKLALLLLIPFLTTACLPFFNKGADQNSVNEAEQGGANLPPVEIKLPPPEEFISLADVTGGTSEGDGYRLKQDNKFIHKVAATLPTPASGSFYEGWLVVPNSEGYISTGKLTAKNGRWVLSFQSDTDYSNYSQVVVTLEPDDGNPAPAKHILEGQFAK